VEPTRTRALDAIDAACRWRAGLPAPQLDQGYLLALAAVEDLPHNAGGADKTWVGRLLAESIGQISRAERIT
jgi:hypothetical protein